MRRFLTAALCAAICAPAALAAELDLGKAKLSGEIEVQGYYERHGMREGKGAETSESKLVVPTVALDLEVPLAESLTGYVSVLWDETSEEEGVVVDVATLTWTHDPVKVSAGRMYIPFGDYTTAFVSDPLTLLLGQAQETAALVTVDPTEAITLGAFAFNGEAEEREDGAPPAKHNTWDFGGVIVVRPVEALTFGGSYTADLADSDVGLTLDNLYNDRVAGASAFANLSLGSFRAGAEVVAALSDFNKEDLEWDEDLRPMAWHVEAAYDVTKDFMVALGFDGTKEWIDVPQFRLGAIVSYRAFDNAILSLEYLNGVYDSKFSDQHRMERITLDFDVIF